jgi:hypothetical protein
MHQTRGSTVASVWRGNDPAAQKRWADGFEASMDAGRGHTTAEPGEILCAHDWTSGARAAGLDVNLAQAEGQARCRAARRAAMAAKER